MTITEVNSMIGRPVSDDPKSEKAEVRLTKQQKLTLRALSAEYGRDLSAWIIDRALTTTSVETLFCPGVYMLLKGASVAYVGQSKCCGLRLSAHWTEGAKDFDSFLVIPCQEKDLLEREAWLINALDPPLNRAPGFAGRTTQIMFRVTPELKQQIQETAQAQGVGMSAWLEKLAEKELRRIRKTGRTDRR
jgi:hypothetical protein